MRRCVLCGCWSQLWLLVQLAFPRAREKKRKKSNWESASAARKQLLPALPPSEDCSPPGMETTPGKHGEWRRRAGGASAACLRSV